MIPDRPGTNPVGHAVTWFDNIKLGSWTSLGPLSKPSNLKTAFLASAWPISIGRMTLGAMAIPSVGISACIVRRCSLRRHVYDANTGKPMPIKDFRTQQIPVLAGLAQMFVMQAFLNGSSVFKTFVDSTTDAVIRAGIAAASKVVMMRHTQGACFAHLIGTGLA
jgi:hypothetical protein